MTTFQLYLGISENNINLMKYLIKKKDQLKLMEAKIMIKKISDKHLTEENVKLFKKKKIYGFPALIFISSKNKKIIIGHQNIIQFFNNNIKRFSQNQSESIPTSKTKMGVGEYGNNPDLSDFYSTEMKISDKKEEEDDEFDGDSIKKDLDAKLKAYISRKPKHRTIDRMTPPIVEPQQNENIEYEAGNIEDILKDNIKNSINDDKLTKLATGNNLNDGQDDKMERAWLENNFGNNFG